jgi:hypothetical protein
VDSGLNNEVHVVVQARVRFLSRLILLKLNFQVHDPFQVHDRLDAAFENRVVG